MAFAVRVDGSRTFQPLTIVTAQCAVTIGFNPVLSRLGCRGRPGQTSYSGAVLQIHEEDGGGLLPTNGIPMLDDRQGSSTAYRLVVGPSVRRRPSTSDYASRGVVYKHWASSSSLYQIVKIRDLLPGPCGPWVTRSSASTALDRLRFCFDVLYMDMQGHVGPND